MYNTYLSSTIGFRSKGSLCFSVNDYYFGSERCEKIPSSSSCTCSCCAFSIHGRVPMNMNPRFCYGLRQSTLIQCSASRRLLLGGGDRYCRFSSNDIDRVCCRDSYALEGSSRRKERERGRRGRRFGCMVWEERFERCNSSMDENVDAMLSLLTEDISENLVSVRQRRNKIGTGGIRAEMRRRGVSECSKEENKYVVSGSLGNSSRGKYESSTIKSSEEACSGRKKGTSLRSENSGSRKGGSSGSSYYSALSSDDIDVSDMDIQVDDTRRYVSSYKNKQSIKNDKNLSVGDVRKQHKKYEEVKMHGNKDIVEIGIDWDSRNKAEKLDLISGGQIGTRKESSVQDMYEVSVEGTSSSQRLYDSSRENGSASSTKYVQEAREQRGQKGHEVIQQAESRRETNQVSEVSDIQESDIYRESIENYRASSSEKRFSGREAEQTAALNLVQQARNRKNQTSLQITEQNESTRKSQQRKEMSLDLQSRNNVLQVHDSHMNKASTSHEISETRTKNRKEESASFMNSIQETEQRRTQAAQQDDMIKNQESTYVSTFDAKDNTAITSSHGSDVKRGSKSKRFETRMKNKEGDSTILMSSVQERKHQNTQADQQIDWMSESRKENDDFINTSVMGDINSVGFTSTQKLTETKNSPEILSTSPVDLGPGGRKIHSKTSEQVIRKVLSRNESERISKSSSFGRNSTERASSSQTPPNLDHQSEMQQIDEHKKDKGNSQAMVTPPPPQLVLRGSPKTVPSQSASKGYSTQKDLLETSGSSSSAMYVHSQTGVPVLRNDLDSGTSNSEMHSELTVNEDALVSANQLEESSTMFVGEFMERLRHEVSASEVLEDRTSSQTTSIHKDENIMQQSTNPQASENLQSQVVGSRISSSRTRGPSDEIWDVDAPSSLEPLKRITPGEASSSGGGVIAKSSNRSLWSVVSDIVRLRWSAGSETHKSSVKSGGRSSSNESENSEAWFSGHEPDDKNDEHARKSRRGMPKKSRSADQLSQRKSPEQSQQEASEGMGFQEETIQIGAATSSSSNTAERSPASKGASTASKEDTSGRKEDENRVRGTPFSASTDDSPLPSHTRRLIRSPPVEHVKVEGNSEVPKSSSAEIVEHPITERPAEASGVDGKEGQLKQRKLQRNNQVLSERFEEWEEAYLIESEQRKIDEMFMREALLEAKKAADTWEVPVGAVLVQHGKIIARGCNLVEELRDSTAHAEMICIREASNVLRTWRLSETTLYVTLEPCPMCAGAILQARVDNVVWGAPNKLLGADGSWVRLFPGGGEGASDSDPTNQSAGPVHPFHPKITVRRGILATECADAMQQFFQLRRRTKERKKSESPPPSCLPISTQPKFLSKMHNIFSVMFCL